MSARDKINGMCALGIIAFASLLGTASQSWNMFLVTRRSTWWDFHHKRRYSPPPEQTPSSISDENQ